MARLDLISQAKSFPRPLLHIAILGVIALLLVGCAPLPGLIVTPEGAEEVAPAPQMPNLLVPRTTLTPQPTATPAPPTATPEPTPTEVTAPAEPQATPEPVEEPAPDAEGGEAEAAPSAGEGEAEAAPIVDVPLADKIGQMFLLGFAGRTAGANEVLLADLQERNLGGILIFDHNIESPAQLQMLIAGLQAKASTPLLVAADHEGGLITRFKEDDGFPASVSHKYLGAENNLAETTERAALMAGTLVDVGVNLNLAPVVDVNANPANPIIANYWRSFSADSAVVSRQALAFIEGHHNQGVLTTLKHFPGYGSWSGKTLSGFPDLSKTWSEDELVPFQTVIDAGQADAIMVAHVFNTNLDPDYPASLSQPILTGILREQLGYDGVVISDDMLTPAILDSYGLETALQAGIDAGLDIFAASNNQVNGESFVAQAVDLISQWVEEGAISEARIDQSYRRIQALKAHIQ